MTVESQVKEELSDKHVFFELIDQIPKIEEQFWQSFGGFYVIYDRPAFCDWKERVKYQLRKLEPDETIAEILRDFDKFNGYHDKRLFAEITAKCKLVKENYDKYQMRSEDQIEKMGREKVFIVHGHDVEAKVTVARTLEKLGLEPIILHEQADHGRTIIEKLESFMAEAAYAIILYTECDLGRAKEKSEEDNQYRARQNVVFEHGLFVGCLGRERVCALVKGNVEVPGDLDGVVYIKMDENEAWILQVCKNLKSIGINVNLNDLV